MKKKTNLLMKLKMIRLLFSEVNEPMVFVTCHYCGSSHIKYANGTMYVDMYTSQYECVECGAKATNNEYWKKESKP